MLEIINDAGERYRGVIPQDCWHEPYMPATELARDFAKGVELWAYERDGKILGMMGLQRRSDVALIRHAHVRPAAQGASIGSALLHHMDRMPSQPVMIGTWAGAEWAIRFYQRHGIAFVGPTRSTGLSTTYWIVPPRQMEVSVVLARA